MTAVGRYSLPLKGPLGERIRGLRPAAEGHLAAGRQARGRVAREQAKEREGERAMDGWWLPSPWLPPACSGAVGPRCK